jgi:hypothetical protein
MLVLICHEGKSIKDRELSSGMLLVGTMLKASTVEPEAATVAM